MHTHTGKHTSKAFTAESWPHTKTEEGVTLAGPAPECTRGTSSLYLFICPLNMLPRGHFYPQIVGVLLLGPFVARGYLSPSNKSLELALHWFSLVYSSVHA